MSEPTPEERAVKWLRVYRHVLHGRKEYESEQYADDALLLIEQRDEQIRAARRQAFERCVSILRDSAEWNNRNGWTRERDALENCAAAIEKEMER